MKTISIPLFPYRIQRRLQHRVKSVICSFLQLQPVIKIAILLIMSSQCARKPKSSKYIRCAVHLHTKCISKMLYCKKLSRHGNKSKRCERFKGFMVRFKHFKKVLQDYFFKATFSVIILRFIHALNLFPNIKIVKTAHLQSKTGDSTI